MEKRYFKKTKVVPQKKAREQLPRIFRSIPERPRKFSFREYLRERRLHTVALVTLSSCFLAAIVFTLPQIKQAQEQKQKVEKAYNLKMSEIKKWEAVVQKHRDYRDGYFKLAALEYEVGNKGKARLYSKKALYIDPNFEPAERLMNLLQQ